MSDVITNWADLIDSRDVIERVQYLQDIKEWMASGVPDVEPLTLDEEAELATLEALVKQGEALEDWVHGVTLVRYSYFTEYARDYAHDLEYVKGDNPLLDHIDWESWADALHQEYTELDFNGVEYFAR